MQHVKRMRCFTIFDLSGSTIFLAHSQIYKSDYSDSSYESFRPTIRMEQLGSQWMDFYETLYLSIFHKSVEEFRVSLKWQKQRVIYMNTNKRLDHISIGRSWKEETLKRRVLEKIKTQILCSVHYFPKSCRLWEDNVWNTVDSVRPQIKTWHMLNAGYLRLNTQS
jgi:hypothetical protein